MKERRAAEKSAAITEATTRLLELIKAKDVDNIRALIDSKPYAEIYTHSIDKVTYLLNHSFKVTIKLINILFYLIFIIKNKYFFLFVLILIFHF